MFDDLDPRSRHPLSRQAAMMIVAGGLIGVFAVVAIAIGYRVDWTGFGSFVKPSATFQPMKTLWDWLDLLIIPAVLALLVAWFNAEQKRRESEAALDKQREDILKNYLDCISELLIDKRLADQQWPASAAVVGTARARTITALQRLDGDRRGTVVRFLHELRLIDCGKVIISLVGADLSDVVLVRARLGGANLSETRLDCADLRKVHLREAQLCEAQLRRADIRRGDLIEAHLHKANMFHADLRRAKLSGADLSRAKLRKANLGKAVLIGADLQEADLIEADLAEADLREADLRGAKLYRANLRDALYSTGPDGTQWPDHIDYIAMGAKEVERKPKKDASARTGTVVTPKSGAPTPV